MFMYTLAPKFDKDKICINMLDPGVVQTALGGDAPLYIRVLRNLFTHVTVRTPEKGTWCVVNAVAVAGPESHGRFLQDKTIEEVSKFIVSPTGKEIQKRLWTESLQEAVKMTTLPPAFTA